MKKQKFYAVFNGRQCGVFGSWPACERQIINFKHAQFKGYPTLKAATKAMKAFRKKGVIPPQLKKFDRAVGEDPRISGEDFICVDGACTHSGQAEFQAFLFPDGTLINRMHPFYGTNNTIHRKEALLNAVRLYKNIGLEVDGVVITKEAVDKIIDRAIEFAEGPISLPDPRPNEARYSL